MSIKTIHNRVYSGIITGILVRGSIADSRTFRVRRGNGFYNSVAGAFYQDQYAYFVPTSINNTQSQPYRRQWAAAVHKWNTDLTAAQKATYEVRAAKGLHMSGFNLFMREAMKGKVDMFVDRGDPAAWDFDVGDFTDDAAWHDLNLSSLIPAGAKAVLIGLQFLVDAPGAFLAFRKNGNSNGISTSTLRMQVAGVYRGGDFVCAVDANRVIEYYQSNATWSNVGFCVKGWWT